MTYTPIARGATNWDTPVNTAFTDQDARITSQDGRLTTAESTISTQGTQIAGKVSKTGDTLTGAYNISNPSGVAVVLTSNATNNIQEWRDSGGVLRSRIGLNGNIVGESTTFLINGVQIGSTSTDFGGGAGGIVGIDNASTAPTTNPTSGVIAYSEAATLKVRHGSGNVWEAARGFQLAPGPSPADQNLIAWNYDSENASSTNSLTLGTVFLHKVYLPAGVTITNLGLTVTTAGSALTYARIALYNAAGTQLAISADQSSSWNSTGFKTNALGVAQSITTSGYYYIGVLTTGTTAPICASSPGIQNTFNANVTGAGLRHASVATGQTALPASITMSGNTSTGTSTWVTAF